MPPRQKTGGRAKAAFFLAGSILVAFIVAAAVLQIVRSYKAQIEAANKPPETIPVVVARRNLYTGIQVTPDDVVVREVMPQMVPQDTDGSLVFKSLEEVLGRTPKERILANEIIRGERLARRNSGEGLNAIITPGKRAMAIMVDEAEGLVGLLQPGNYVDVIVTLRPDDVSGKTSFATETILQGVQVLAVNANLAPTEQNGSNGTSKPAAKDQNRRSRGTVTLELTLEEAEKLALSSARGDLHLALRSDVEITQQTTHGPITASAVIGWDTTPKVAPAGPAHPAGKGDAKDVPPASQTVIIQGSKTDTIRYDAQGNKIESHK